MASQSGSVGTAPSINMQSGSRRSSFRSQAPSGLELPSLEPDAFTGKQNTPHTPSEGVDKATIELLHTIEHELRTPIHGMIAMIDSMLGDIAPLGATDEQKKVLQDKVQNASTLGSRVSAILDDFSDFAKETLAAKEAESHALVAPDEEVDLGQLLDDVAREMWQIQVDEIRTEQGLDARLPPPPELILQIDSNLRGWKSVVSVDLLKKVARKLISNALRFTRKDGFVEISLSASSEVHEDGQRYLQMTVEDNGNGMTEEFICEQLFQPFAKADTFKSGAGLSMALCASIVRRMGGSMQVSSDQGRGTVVAVLLPIESAPQEMEGRHESSAPDQLVYLWGFQGVGLQRLAGAICAQLATFANLYTTTDVEECDYLLLPEEVCYETKGGIDAILAKVPDGVKIGVLQAHEDSGIEVAALLKSGLKPTFVTRKPFGPSSFARLLDLANKPAPSKDAPAVSREEAEEMVQSDGSGRLSSDGNDALGAPSNDNSHPERANYCPPRTSKRTSDLLVSAETADEILRASVPPPSLLSRLTITERDEGTPPPRAPFTVLCVEDNPLNMRILTQALKQSRVEFFTAADGIEAVTAFKKHRPSIVLLDINMPNLDGFGAATQMRAYLDESEEQANPPFHRIIAVTALSDDDSRRRGIEECGMDEWRTKPLRMAELKTLLREWQSAYEDACEAEEAKERGD